MPSDLKVSALALTAYLLAGAGCVGPMTPFGATGVLGPRPAGDSDGAPSSPQSARLRFLPRHQVLHGSTNFSIFVEDPYGVPEDFHLTVSYNGIDVTRTFLAQAEVTAQDPLRHEVKLTSRHLRLPAGVENRVKVTYRRNFNALPTTAIFTAPVCSAFTTGQMLLQVPHFQPSSNVIQLINQHSASRKLNPNFVAGLVAQESGFNPNAISRNRAIGLTQVTTLGESEIIKRYQDWPRYPGASEMPIPILRLAVLDGQIHSGNEWRLDPSRSIQGGVEYLSYLGEYWNRPDKHAQIERRLGPSETALSEVLLASYNSGAARVGEALERGGDQYLKDEELGEAFQYVRRVVSYCDQFEHPEE